MPHDLSEMAFQIAQTLWYFNVVFGVITALLFVTKGPNKYVKRMLLAVVLSHMVHVGIMGGIMAPISYITTLVVIILVTNTIAFSISRFSRLAPEEAHPSSCPDFAKKNLGTWENQLQSLGYSSIHILREKHKPLGIPSIMFTRIFMGSDVTHTFSTTAEPSSKTQHRTIVSELENGTWITTIDTVGNYLIFESGIVIANRVDSKLSCAEMLESHKKLVAKTGMAPLKITDSNAFNEKLRTTWLNHLVESGQFRIVNDDWYGITLPSIGRITVGTYANWLA